MNQINYNIEGNIEKIGKEISEKKEMPEHKGTPEKELIRQAIQPIIKKADEDSQIAQSAAVLEEGVVLPEYLKESPPEVKNQIERLVELAFYEGVDKAVSEGRKSSAFILDAFHDALTDKLYDELKKRGLI